MIAGYIVRAQENGGVFYEGTLSDVLCPNCGRCLDNEYHPQIINKQRVLDISYTNDLRLIFSERLMEYLRDISATFGQKLKFYPVNEHPKEFYLVPVEPRIRFNYRKRGTKFIGPCKICGGYKEIVGSTPAYLIINGVLDRGVYHTDVEFGTLRNKSPLMLVDPTTKMDLEKMQIDGLYFKEAYDLDVD